MSKKIQIKDTFIGGGERIKIQSMTFTKTSKVEETVSQIKQLERVGCDIVRVSILDEFDAKSLFKIKEKISIPLVADIHFSSNLAVMAIENGADKIRINPGNIGGEQEIKFVADAIKRHKIPVRVGSNTGSISKEHFLRYGRSSTALVESALDNVGLLEKYGVNDIVVAVKSSNVKMTIDAYRLLSKHTDYPLHLGVTEAGGGSLAVTKSAVGIGSLLVDGIGDTIRVSLSDDSVQEVLSAKEILRACGLDDNFVEVISCPTCGRCEYDCMTLASEVRGFVKESTKKLKIAVMGCVVNGPGEAKDCDLGIAGGKNQCVLFKKGEIFKTLPTEQAKQTLFEMIKELI